MAAASGMTELKPVDPLVDSYNGMEAGRAQWIWLVLTTRSALGCEPSRRVVTPWAVCLTYVA